MTWSHEWPIEPGHYWVFGWPELPRVGMPGLYMADVEGPMAMIASVDRHLLYQGDECSVVWKRAELPDEGEAMEALKASEGE